MRRSKIKKRPSTLVKREASRQFFLYVFFHSVWTSIVSVFDSD